VLRERGQPRLLVTCHRRESWKDGLHSVATALRELAHSGAARIDVLLHPNPHVSRTLERLLGDCPGISLLPPCAHHRLLSRMLDCDLMLSDSGGVQEEAPALGVPLLVLREKTERPEAIGTGNMQLVGTDTGRIIRAVTDLLDDRVKLAAMARPSLPYGDGRSGHRIAGIIDQWLSVNASRSVLRAR
jgi:UDP-N-acetylglucosamine 2-epimerase (non-hydrolysing)